MTAITARATRSHATGGRSGRCKRVRKPTTSAWPAQSASSSWSTVMSLDQLKTLMSKMGFGWSAVASAVASAGITDGNAGSPESPGAVLDQLGRSAAQSKPPKPPAAKMLPPQAKTHAKAATQLLLESAAAARALIGKNVTLMDGRSGIVRNTGNGFLTVHLTTADGGAKVSVRQSQLVAESEPTAAPAASYVGRRVSKHFPKHGTFSGEVAAYDTTSKLYLVTYDDGDSETVDLGGVLPYLLQQPPLDAAKPPPAAAAGCYVGRRVSKHFPKHGTFSGEVTAYEVTSKLYVVEYDDGDTETVELGGVLPYLLQQPPLDAAKPPPAAAAGCHVGRRVSKHFPNHGTFSGEVTSYDTTSKLYVVAYDDGDSETVELGGVLPFLLEHSQPSVDVEAAHAPQHWTEAEDLMVLKAVEQRDKQGEVGCSHTKAPPIWADVAAQLGRSRNSVRQRWAVLKVQIGADLFDSPKQSGAHKRKATGVAGFRESRMASDPGGCCRGTGACPGGAGRRHSDFCNGQTGLDGRSRLDESDASPVLANKSAVSSGPGGGQGRPKSVIWQHFPSVRNAQPTRPGGATYPHSCVFCKRTMTMPNITRGVNHLAMECPSCPPALRRRCKAALNGDRVMLVKLGLTGIGRKGLGRPLGATGGKTPVRPRPFRSVRD